MGSAVKNEEYVFMEDIFFDEERSHQRHENEVIKGASENLFSEIVESEMSEQGAGANDTQYNDNATEGLRLFSEHPETMSKHWMERIIQETSPLAHWLQQKAGDFQNNLSGLAFVQCPLPHPYDNLPSADRNEIKENFGDRDSFTLEASLNSISKVNKRGKCKCLRFHGGDKFRPDVKSRGLSMHGVPPTVAIENYCQQHAYSRARLLRTDRRELANELLEEISTDSDSAEILVAQSSRSDSPLLSTQAVTPTHLDQGALPYRSVRRKEIGDNNMVRKNSFVDDINEHLRISPCVFYPNEALTESRKSNPRRKSLPRLISK